MVDYYREKYGFEDLQKIVIRLRQPDGCPWDAAQTHTSIRKDFLEEVYEVCEAIDRADQPTADDFASLKNFFTSQGH